MWDTLSGVLTLPFLGYLPCMLFRGGSGLIGGVQNLDQKGLLNFFVGNYFSQRRPRVSLSVNTGRRWRGKCFASRGEQIILEGTQKQLHFGISLEFSLVGECNARFIKKISQLKSDIRSCRCKNFSLSQASVLTGGVRTPRTLPLGPPLIFCKYMKIKNKLVKCSHGLINQVLLRIAHDSCLLSVY